MGYRSGPWKSLFCIQYILHSGSSWAMISFCLHGASFFLIFFHLFINLFGIWDAAIVEPPRVESRPAVRAMAGAAPEDVTE